MSEATGTLVVALGNPLRGDDGVGLAVLDALDQSGRLPLDVTLAEGGKNVINGLLIGGYQKIILIDAAEIACEPGKWMRFSPGNALFLADPLVSGNNLHHISLPEALEIGKALGKELPEIVIYGVHPVTIAPSLALSEPVRNVLTEICQAILEELCIEKCDLPKP